jgi:hypothetical protein
MQSDLLYLLAKIAEKLNYNRFAAKHNSLKFVKLHMLIENRG